MAKKPFTFEFKISIDGEPPVDMDTLTPERKAYALEKMRDRLSRNMSDYYTNHLDEFEALGGEIACHSA